MKSPIFIFGDGGPFIFRTVEDAAGYLEAVDVENGEYEAVFDADGCRFNLHVTKESGRLLGLFPIQREKVEIIVQENLLPQSEELKIQLAHHLGSKEAGVLNRSLNDLVQEMVKKFGYTA